MALPEPAVILSLACFNNVPRKKFPKTLEGDSKCWAELSNESRAEGVCGVHAHAWGSASGAPVCAACVGLGVCGRARRRMVGDGGSHGVPSGWVGATPRKWHPCGCTMFNARPPRQHRWRFHPAARCPGRSSPRSDGWRRRLHWCPESTGADWQGGSGHRPAGLLAAQR
jgi:hypothetical protein